MPRARSCAGVQGAGAGRHGRRVPGRRGGADRGGAPRRSPSTGARCCSTSPSSWGAAWSETRRASCCACWSGATGTPSCGCAPPSPARRPSAGLQSPGDARGQSTKSFQPGSPPATAAVAESCVYMLNAQLSHHDFFRPWLATAADCMQPVWFSVAPPVGCQH